MKKQYGLGIFQNVFIIASLSRGKFKTKRLNFMLALVSKIFVPP